MYCIVAGSMAALSSTVATSGWSVALGLVLGLAVVGYGGTYAWKLGVEATSAGVRLHNPMGSRLVPWHEVDRVEMGAGYPYRAWLVMRDGSRTKTWGLGASGVRHQTSLAASRALVDDLNVLVRQHREES